jgi:CheY-like chemotaxis protein
MPKNKQKCKGKKILLVEDDFYVREIYKTALEDRGFVIIEASNGEKAIALYNKHRIDLVLLDIMLPRVNGVEVLEHIRSHPRDDKKTPTIIITNVADASIEKEVKQFRPEVFMIKSAVKIRSFVDQIERMF